MASRAAPIPNIENGTGDSSFEKWQQEPDGRRTRERTGRPLPCASLVDSPVGFAQILKIVHVAAGGGVLRVQSLPLLGVGDLDEVPVVLHHEFAPGELLGGDHAPAFAIDEVDLLGGDTRGVWLLTATGALVQGGLPGCLALAVLLTAFLRYALEFSHFTCALR